MIRNSIYIVTGSSNQLPFAAVMTADYIYIYIYIYISEGLVLQCIGPIVQLYF